MAKDFDFLQDHSDTFITMAYSWDRRIALKEPDGFGKKTGDCGDTISMYLAVEKDCLKHVQFEIEGCINTSACCNALAEIIEGKTIEEGWNLSPEMIIDYLETLPADHHHCAELAVGAFYLALADCRDKTHRA